jgi:hypothetical protein
MQIFKILIQIEMKKILTLLITIAFVANLSKAQDTMYVHQKGKILTRIAINNIDSILFKSTKLPANLNVTFPKQGSFGANLLSMGDSSDLNSNVNYSITAIQPKGLFCAVRLKIIEQSGNGTWTIDNSKAIRWPYINDFDFYYSEFTPKDSTIAVELPIVFSNSGSCTFQIDIIKDFKDKYERTIKKYYWK